MKFRFFFFSLVVSLTCFTKISAHEVWIEDSPDGQLWVRFAEYGDEYEKSPGHLDGLAVPNAFTLGADGKLAPLDVVKKVDGYLLSGSTPAGAAFAEAPFAVMGKAPARLPIFYARWHTGSAPAEPALTFDLVPTGTPGEARLILRGQPVSGAKVTLYPPDEADRELTTDDAGLIRFPVEKKGLYLLVARHQREDRKGFHYGKLYEVVSHNCSLAWRKP